MKNVSDYTHRHEPLQTTNKNVKLAIGAVLPRCRCHRLVYILSPSNYQRLCTYRPTTL